MTDLPPNTAPASRQPVPHWRRTFDFARDPYAARNALGITGTGGGIADAPSDGNIYGRKNGSWVVVPSGGGAGVVISATPPASPTVGELWWDSTGGQLYIYYNDGTSTQWVTVTNIPVPIGVGAVISSTAPSSPSPGTLWWNSTDGQLYIWYDDGTSQQWVVTVLNPP